MSRIAVTTTAIALLGSATCALAANDLQTTLDLAVRGMIDAGSEVAYSDRVVGNDGSVLYKDLVITNKDDGLTVSAPWIKGTPSASDPSVVTFTFAKDIAVTGTDTGMEFTFHIVTDGMELTTNGLLREAMSKEDVSVNFGADSFRLKGGEADNPVLRKLLADFGSVGFEMLTSKEQSHVEGGLALDKMDAVYDFTTDGTTQSGAQTSGPLNVTFAFDVPSDENDAMGYLDGSKSAIIKLTGGASTSTANIDSGDMAFSIASTGEPSSLLLQMVDGTFLYDMQNGKIQATVTPGAGIPIPPVDLGLSALGMKVAIPFNTADAPEKASVNLMISDLTVGEGLWSMIDPGKTIPRDPAQLNIDMEAMVQLDPIAMAAGADPMEAGKIHSLDINEILLSVAGAMAKATGAFTFNNDGPFPMPLGKANIELDGITTLSDKLVALGLLDQMQAGMAMGMMMAFAKPGDQPDQFISEITVSEDGILANGQPIQ